MDADPGEIDTEFRFAVKCPKFDGKARHYFIFTNKFHCFGAQALFAELFQGTEADHPRLLTAKQAAELREQLASGALDGDTNKKEKECRKSYFPVTSFSVMLCVRSVRSV